MPDMPDIFDTQETRDIADRAERSANERTLIVHWEDPSLGPRIAAERGLNGFEYLRAIVAGEIPPPPITRLMGLELVTVEDGRVVFAATPGEQHYNPIGVVHGGLAATLLDSAIGCALQTKAPPGFFYTTIELKVNYVRPLLAGMGRVFGEATVLHAGRQTALAEARVVDANGKLYAHATSSCMLIQPRSDNAQ
jgi:uncharacterized protein (TIGR00369 family)